MHEGAIEKFVAYGGRGLESLILSGGFSSVQHGEEMGLDLLPRLRWAPVLRLPGKPRWRWQARVWPPFAGTWKDCLEKQQLQDKILEWDALPAWLGSAPPQRQWLPFQEGVFDLIKQLPDMSPSDYRFLKARWSPFCLWWCLDADGGVRRGTELNTGLFSKVLKALFL